MVSHPGEQEVTSEQKVRSEQQVRVIRNQQLNEQSVLLTLEAPAIAQSAQPGQFVNLACNKFLRRPIGIMQTDRNTGLIKIGIRIQGEGTRWLANAQPGDSLSALGPLGHGFELANCRRIITVGGGTGVFPLFFVQQRCHELDLESIAVCGFRSRTDSVLTGDYAGLGCRTLFASDCGDLDVPGHAAQALLQLLSDLPEKEGTAILTCGPKVMMQAVARIAAEYKIPCQVSLEERMACGIGVCLVCACAVKNGGEQGTSYQRCCVEGPVFPAEVIQWST
ncbi:MAG TPA: dihydroorotate dehydrogenase electron transfer subunit [Clostridiales bacterium]|nr:dihydroorotate dehydrogenase electron transfer subunit [Clostridiales bacterium]